MTRPKKEETLAKTKDVHLRMNETEYDLLAERAKANRMTVSDFVRSALDNQKVIIKYEITADVPEIKKLISEFGKIGSNLNQIARYFNQGGIISTEMKNEIRKSLRDIYEMKYEVMKMAGDYQTEKQFLRDAIDDAASTARSPEEFSKILDEKYHIIFKISRNRYSYLHPGRKKYITGRNLGTRYTEDFLLKTFEENTKSHKEQKEEILEQQTPNTSTDSPTVPFSDTSAIPAPFIFIKSDLRLVIDLQTCIKAQQSEAYAQKVKLTNLKQMAQTVAYIQEHGYDSLDDFHATLDQASDQTSASRKSLKDTEQQLKDMNEQIHFTGQYLAYKNVYADYRKSRNKEKFYEEHQAELSLYDTALRTLKEKSGGNKLPSMKALYAEKDRLVELRNRQREDFFNHRDYERELRTVSANIDMILKKNYEQLHDRKEPNL